ncbi:GTPase ObgE [Candidatus Microgenomates bacterium]|nr:GTPase ObgE [Candidatus Microgenomates bacterium]
MLTDEAEIVVEGGHGGPGKASFYKKAVGPDGGNGGKGGDLYFETTTDLYALNRYMSKKHFLAPMGERGGSNKKSGLDANDLVLIVPIGTDLTDLDTGEVFSLDTPGQRVLVCKGGIGGLGNADRANARMTTPLKAQPGLPGQVRKLRLNLRLIAQYGLIGLPSSGKSSLLNALTKANAKVGDYPFTTLEPNLGELNGRIIADIPGLIEGASNGKGLGDRFLKHIERVSVLLHCVSSDSTDPIGDYKTIREELKKYSPELLEKKEIILRTKSDVCKPKKLKGLPVSILDDESLLTLKSLLK